MALRDVGLLACAVAAAAFSQVGPEVLISPATPSPPPSPQPPPSSPSPTHVYLCRVIGQSLQASEVASAMQADAVSAATIELDRTREAFDKLRRGIFQLEQEEVDIDIPSLVGPDGVEYLEEKRSTFLTETCTDEDFCEQSTFDDAAAVVESVLPFVVGALKKYEIDTSTLTLDDFDVAGVQASWGSVAMTIGAAEERLARESDNTNSAVALMREAIETKC